MDYSLRRGPKKRIDNADQLIDLWEKYIKHVKDNPWLIVDYVGKDAKQVNKPHITPFTKFGFATFCGYARWESIAQKKEDSKELLDVITRIEQMIYDQKLHGASIGAFNSNIIAADLGLKNRTENTNKTELNISVSEDLNKKLDDLIEGE